MVVAQACLDRLAVMSTDRSHGVLLVRALSPLLLVVQLFSLVTPVLCHMAPVAACHETTSTSVHLPTTPPAPSSPACGMPAQCGLPSVAEPPSVAMLTLDISLHREVATDVARLVPADPLSPLPPPPEA